MMMLGTLIPLLLLYIENALSSISAFTQESVTVDLGGVEVDLGHDAWQDLARRAVGKEYNVLMSLVDEVEGILKLRHCAGKKEEGLGAIVKAGGGALAGEAVQRELGNKNHETGEPPFCLGLLWMIRGMAERIGVGVVGAN